MARTRVLQAAGSGSYFLRVSCFYYRGLRAAVSLSGVTIGTRSHCDMNSTQALPSDMCHAKRSASPDRARLFYAGASALLWY